MTDDSQSARALLDRVAEGDSSALAQLYDENVDGLYAFVFFRVGHNQSVAEDVVQETFLQALDRIDAFDADRGSPRAWLCTLSRNIIRKHLRQQPQGDDLQQRWDAIDHSLRELYTALDGGQLGDDVLEQEQTRDLVAMTVANIPDRYQLVLHEKYVSGLTLDELARRRGSTVDATKSLLARARRAFRDTFLALSRQGLVEHPHE